jgi:hypothetical protein
MNHPAWFLLHPRVVPETLGLIPDHAWVLILQPDGSYEIARID